MARSKNIETKQQFMEQLSTALEKAGVSGKDEILMDFEQHFIVGSEKGKNEAEVCKSLGSIKDIVSQYSGETQKPEIPAISEIPPISDIPEFFYGKEFKESPLTLELEEIIPASVETDPKIMFMGETPKKNKPAQEIEQTIANAPKLEEEPQAKHIEKIEYAEEKDYNKKETNNNNYHTSYAHSGVNIDLSGLIACLVLDVLVLSWALPTLVGLIGGFIGVVGNGVGCAFGLIFSDFSIWGAIYSPFSTLTNIAGGVALMALCGLGVLLAIKMVKGFIKLIKTIVRWHKKQLFKNSGSFEKAQSYN